jgi:hypothetical protein
VWLIKVTKVLSIYAIDQFVYKRYTLDEVRRKIIHVLQNNSPGLSGVELANKTGINRITVTKYLHILSTIGLIRKKTVGSINVWFLERGVMDFESPINYLEIQQQFMNVILGGDGTHAHKIIMNVINSSVEQIRILTDVILPTHNTINELYNRGRLGKTELISFSNIILQIIDLMNFNVQPEKVKSNAHALFVAGSEDQVYQAKIGQLSLQILGWNSSYIGNVKNHIDPFFDIDFQRYILKVWNNKKGLLLLFICSSEEISLRFLSAATRSLKAKLKGRLDIILSTTPELQAISKGIEPDYVTTDLQSLIDWSEQEYELNH